MAQPGTLPTHADSRSRSSDDRPPPEGHSHSLPVIFEDRSSLDWSEGDYTADVTITRDRTSVMVRHRLTGNEPLLRAVESGQALFATELRCPRTLHSQQVAAGEVSQRVDWDPDHVIWEDSYLVNGLVAVGGVPIRSDALNPTVWPDGETPVIPAGWWLVHGDMYRLNPSIRSLLSFHRDESLDSGRMRVEEDTTQPHPHFRVKLARDIYKPLRRNVQMAGLIGAFALMPSSAMAADGMFAEHPAAQELRDILSEASVPDWDATDGYDPTWAATTFEQFHSNATRSSDTEMDG